MYQNYLILGGAGLVGLGIYLAADKVTLKAEEEFGALRDGFPEFSLEQVAANSGSEDGGRVWVTYKHGVYDVTDFVKMHPGATKLLMAAGGSVEPFWETYAVHQKNPLVAWRLEQYRVGNLKSSDVASQVQAREMQAPFSQRFGSSKHSSISLQLNPSPENPLSHMH